MKTEFKLVRPSPTNMRIWRNEEGDLFLADSSGDKRERIGTPNDTDDGPLQLVFIAPTHEIIVEYGHTHLMVQDKKGKTKTVSVNLPVALFIAEYLKMRVILKVRDEKGDVEMYPLIVSQPARTLDTRTPPPESTFSSRERIYRASEELMLVLRKHCIGCGAAEFVVTADQEEAKIMLDNNPDAEHGYATVKITTKIRDALREQQLSNFFIHDKT